MDKPASSAQAQPPAAPVPDERMDNVLRLACYSVIGLFGLGLLTVLKIASDLVVPIVGAILVGTILSRISDRLTRLGLSPMVSGLCVVGAAIAISSVLINALIDPFTAFISQAPKMAEEVIAMTSPILQPLANLKNALFQTHATESVQLAGGSEAEWLTSFLGRLTPALGELLVFFATLAFFVAGRSSLRRRVILALPERESRLTAIKTIGAVEAVLANYFGSVAVVYVAVATATGIVAFACGLSNPLLWSAMTFVASFIPYLGPALITVSLAASGLLSQGHSLLALAPALAFVGVHAFSEIFVIPTMLGRRHEINPLLIFLSIVFWSWMWGPVGAILAVPILLSALTFVALSTEDEPYLP
ncbi:MAG: AI-2E family transporter [Beijerinckiaceae bacterium]|nr:AI-2E family transporter [Beijerinckiaceae bacterium]